MQVKHENFSLIQFDTWEFFVTLEFTKICKRFVKLMQKVCKPFRVWSCEKYICAICNRFVKLKL